MKKKILIGLVSLLVLLPFGVNAETLESIEEGNNSSNANATVGEVDVPIYNVEIYWNSFEFNWKYNEETAEYEWEAGEYVDTIPLDANRYIDENNFDIEKKNICLDSTCTTRISENTTYEEVIANKENYYYYVSSTPLNVFDIFDDSRGVEIVPSVKWTSSEGYEYVEGKFEYVKAIDMCKMVVSSEIFDLNISEGVKMYSDSTCETEIEETVTEYPEPEYQDAIYMIGRGTTYADLTTEEIPEDGRLDEPSKYSYHLSLNLTNKTEPTSTPQTGDTIGTITITIKAK